MPAKMSKTLELHNAPTKPRSPKRRGFPFRSTHLYISRSKKVLFWFFTAILLITLDVGYLHFRERPPLKGYIDQITTIKLNPKAKPTPTPEVIDLAPTPDPAVIIDITNWRTYTNDDVSLSFQYPSNWQILDASQSASPLSLQVTLEPISQDEAVGAINHNHSYYQRIGFVPIGDYYAERFSRANGKYNSEYVIIPFEPNLTMTIHATTTSLSPTTNKEIAIFDKIISTVEIWPIENPSSNTQEIAP